MSRMPLRLHVFLFAGLVSAGLADAHEDRILVRRADGTIPEVPAEFGATRLVVTGLGSRAPVVALHVGRNRTVLPSCVTERIRTDNFADIRVTASWWHRETVLPFYLNIEFYDPGRKPGQWPYPSVSFLFNLRDGKLIEANRTETTWFGNGGRIRKIDFSSECIAAMADILTRWRPKLR